MSGGADWYTDIIEDLYAGTLEEAAWNSAMLGIADAVRASGAALLSFNPSNGIVLRDETHRVDPSVIYDYRSIWAPQDCRLTAFLPAPVGQPVTELSLGLSDWRLDPILHEFLIPADSPHFMPAWLFKSDTKAVTLSMQGTRKRGPFEAKDIERFRRILPHVGRALAIRDRLEQAELRADTWAKRMDHTTFGVIVLDSAGRYLEANTNARKLLDSECGMRVKGDGTLWLRQPAGNEIQRWILSGSPPGRDVDRLLRIPRQHGLSLSVMLAPVPFRPTFWVGREPRWVLLLFDPHSDIQLDPEFARQLEISAAEASLAALIVGGYSLQAAASHLGVSAHTARTQLKAIFKKTGIHSQAALVRAVMLGPAVRTAQSVDSEIGELR